MSIEKQKLIRVHVYGHYTCFVLSSTLSELFLWTMGERFTTFFFSLFSISCSGLVIVFLIIWFSLLFMGIVGLGRERGLAVRETLGKSTCSSCIAECLLEFFEVMLEVVLEAFNASRRIIRIWVINLVGQIL